jgi:hypothetical protein
MTQGWVLSYPRQFAFCMTLWTLMAAIMLLQILDTPQEAPVLDLPTMG